MLGFFLILSPYILLFCFVLNPILSSKEFCKTKSTDPWFKTPQRFKPPNPYCSILNTAFNALLCYIYVAPFHIHFFIQFLQQFHFTNEIRLQKDDLLKIIYLLNVRFDPLTQSPPAPNILIFPTASPLSDIHDSV